MNLTAREYEVCRAIANAKSNKEIANEQGRSHATIKTQVRILMLKTGQRSRTALAVWAVRQGIE